MEENLRENLFGQNQRRGEHPEQIMQDDELEIHLNLGDNVMNPLQQSLSYHLERIQFHWEQIRLIQV